MQTRWDAVSRRDSLLHSPSEEKKKKKPLPLNSDYKKNGKLKKKRQERWKEGRDEFFYDGGISVWHVTTSVCDE